VVRPLLSFIPLMKDISDCGLHPFVLHSTYEGHFGLWFAPFCLSSRLWRTFQTAVCPLLSFIPLMKDISVFVC